MKKIKTYNVVGNEKKRRPNIMINAASKLLTMREKSKLILTTKRHVHPKSAKNYARMIRKKSMPCFRDNALENSDYHFMDNVFLKCNFLYPSSEEEEGAQLLFNLTPETINEDNDCIKKNENDDKTIKKYFDYPVEQVMTPQGNCNIDPQTHNIANNNEKSLTKSGSSFPNLKRTEKKPIEDDNEIDKDPIEDIAQKSLLMIKEDKPEIAPSKSIETKTSQNKIDMNVSEVSLTPLPNLLKENIIKPIKMQRYPKLQRHKVKIIKLEPDKKKRSASFYREM